MASKISQTQILDEKNMKKSESKKRQLQMETTMEDL